MALRYSPVRRVFAGVILLPTVIACGGDDGLPSDSTSVGGFTQLGSGGSLVGQGGGKAAANGGSTATGQGGSKAASGGAISDAGGSGSGGKSTSGSGGSASGGKSSSGGAASGGKSSSGGTASGGKSSSGGAASGGKSASGGSGYGGKSSSGGAASGGKSASGGSGSGGKSSSGGATGSGGSTTNSGAGPTVTCGCTTTSGEFSGNNIKSTIVVDSGETYDGGCKIFRADPSSLGPGTQAEGQDPVFEVNGGTLTNVVLGASAADGIHTTGNATLKNIHWLDIGEDAMTVKGAGNVTLDCGSSKLGDDKTFQVNAASTVTIRNFTARSAGKFMRQNGDTTFKMTVIIDHCDIAGMDECIYRTDSSTSSVTMTNTRYSDIGDSLFIFGSTGYDNQNVAGKVTVSGNVAY